MGYNLLSVRDHCLQYLENHIVLVTEPGSPVAKRPLGPLGHLPNPWHSQVHLLGRNANKKYLTKHSLCSRKMKFGTNRNIVSYSPKVKLLGLYVFQLSSGRLYLITI